MRRLTVLFLLTFACVASALSRQRKIELTETFHPPLKSGSADLFVPLPLKNLTYQKILNETYHSNATWVKKVNIGFDHGRYNVRVLYAHWNNAVKPWLRLREVLWLSDRKGVPGKFNRYFLRSTPHIQTNGIVKKTAVNVTCNAKTPDKKALAIYNWIVKNTFRNPKTRGCGMGDAKSTLTVDNLGGKCADINTLFVALARSSGIPARDAFGLRVAPSYVSKSLGKVGDVSKAEHCRAEYYSVKHKAWYPADAADVRKVILDEHLKLSNPHVQHVVSRLFNRWEGNWVEFNFARNVRLPNGYTVSYLMYPQLFQGHNLISSGINPAHEGYTFTSKVLKVIQ